jgi:RNA-binding protein 25
LEEDKEARRLKEFLEDYEDDRDDPKYYKGSALSRRLKEREKEMELDERDRQREKDELEEIRRKLAEEGHPDVDAQMAKIERERDEHLLPRMHSPQEPPPPSEEEEPRPRSPSSPESDHDDGGAFEAPSRSPSMGINNNTNMSQPELFNQSPAASTPNLKSGQ